MEIVAQRMFSPLYIILDSVFLVFMLALLIVKRRYMTVVFSLLGGLLYMIVDYGIFHLLLGTRKIENGNMFWVLLWMSMSYGFTNFALIWIWLKKDKHFKEITALVWIWWICCPMISKTFSFGNIIKIERTTTAYHGYMALFMVVSYFLLIAYNLFQPDKQKRFNIVWLFTLGVLAQLGWEAGLLIGGIRSAEFSAYQKVMTLITNSLVETNLGMPALYCIYLAVSSRFNENLSVRQKISFVESLKQNNKIRMFKTADGEKALTE